MPNKDTIILFNPLPAKTYDYPGAPIGIPLNLLAISSLLVQEDYNMLIFNGNEKEEYWRKITPILNRTICVGITCMTGYQITDGLNFASAIKKQMDIPVVWGGIIRLFCRIKLYRTKM